LQHEEDEVIHLPEAFSFGSFLIEGPDKNVEGMLGPAGSSEGFTQVGGNIGISDASMAVHLRVCRREDEQSGEQSCHGFQCSNLATAAGWPPRCIRMQLTF
jgi:hypothetical protein